MSFLLRRLGASLLMPLPMGLFLGVVGTALWIRGRRTRLGKLLVAGSLLVLLLLSLPPVADALAGRLEETYPTFPGDSVDYVVVLGSGFIADPSLSATSRLSGAGLFRLTEGMRIATAQPWATLVLSGYGGPNAYSNAEAYRDAAVALGFPAERIVLEPRPRTTAEEAGYLEPLLARHRFALVTSANHMPRAADLFRARGLDPVPGPTEFLARSLPGLRFGHFVPSESALIVSRQAWYETLSRAWAALRGDL